MIDRKELKARAKVYAFNNKWTIWKPLLVVAGITFLFAFVAGLISGFINNKTITSILSLCASLAALPLSIGATKYIMETIHGKTIDLMEILKSKYKLFVPILILMVVSSILIGLGFTLLVIPGIVLALRYAMIGYIAAESDDNMDAIEVMKKSATMMDGHKLEYFVLQLSFIGWLILCELTLGILAIWVMPYMTVTNIYYYEELKKQNN